METGDEVEVVAAQTQRGNDHPTTTTIPGIHHTRTQTQGCWAHGPPPPLTPIKPMLTTPSPQTPHHPTRTPPPTQTPTRSHTTPQPTAVPYPHTHTTYPTTETLNPTALAHHFDTMSLREPTWFMDTGASHHISSNPGTISHVSSQTLNSPLYITVGNGSRVRATAVGSHTLPTDPPPLFSKMF